MTEQEAFDDVMTTIRAQREGVKAGKIEPLRAIQVISEQFQLRFDPARPGKDEEELEN